MSENTEISNSAKSQGEAAGDKQPSRVKKYSSVRTFVQTGLLLVIAGLLVANLIGNDQQSSIAGTTTIARTENQAIDLVNKAVSLISAKQYEAALTVLSEAISVDPEYGLAFYNQGVAFQFLNRTEEAVVSYTSALTFNNQDSNSYYNRGLALRDLGKLNEAESDLRLAATLKPEWAAAKFNLGQVLISLNKTTEGEAFITEAREINPSIGK